MASISTGNLVDAVLRVERMSFDDRVRLGEEVHAAQPNLFFSVLVLQRYGATLAQVEVVLNILLCRRRLWIEPLARHVPTFQ